MNRRVSRLLVSFQTLAILAIAGCSSAPGTGDDMGATATTTAKLIAAEDCLAGSINGKVGICHATGSTTNPYVHIRVSTQGCINGHAQDPGDFVSDDPGCRPCVPGTCAAQGKNCGTIPDGCGGTLDCGTCAAPETCGGAGTLNVCGCTATTCVQLGANCGMIPDGCGNDLDCGTCVAPQTCGGSGTPNVCGWKQNEGLLAYFPFDGNGSDKSGNGHDAAIWGANSTTGICGDAYLFDGLDDLAVVPYDSVFDLTAFTISVWLKLTSFPQGNPNVVGKLQHFYGYGIYVGGDGEGHQVQGLIGRGNWNEWVHVGEFHPALGDWYHYVLTLNELGQATLFVNGEQNGNTATDVQVVNPPDTQIIMGRHYTYVYDWGVNWFLNGTMDEVRIYGRALAPEEVKLLYSLRCPT